MILYYAINQIYPDARPDVDYVLKDEGLGENIIKWNYSSPQPTESQLQEAWGQCKDNLPQPPISEIEQLKKQQADLTFTLMMAGVI